MLGLRAAVSSEMEEMRRRSDEQAEQIERMMAFQDSKGKGKGKEKNGRPRKPRVRSEVPQESRERYAAMVKPDQDYCLIFQQPPIGECVMKANGEWSHRRQLENGTWTCTRQGCGRVHLDVPQSQFAAAMELKRYKEDVNQYFKDKEEKEKQQEAQTASAGGV